MWLRPQAVVWASLALTSAATVNQPNAFYSALRPCPAECQGMSSNWTVYTAVERLRFCEQPMLLDFSIHNSLNNPNTTVKLQTCTSGNANDMQDALVPANATSSKSVAARDTAPSTCVSASESKVVLDLSVGNDAGSASKEDLQEAIEQLQKYLADPTYCNTTFLVGYNNKATVAIYSGAAIDNIQTIPSVLQQLTEQLTDAPAKSMTLQLCDESRNADYIFGAAVDTTGDLAAVQEAVQAWSMGTCVNSTSQAVKTLAGVSVYEVPLVPVVTASNSTLNSTRLHARDSCTTITVVSGDSCASLASKCGISGNTFEQYNPSAALCSTLAIGQRVCCTAGGLPDITPKQNSDGSCATYTVQSGDTCNAIAAANGLTATQVESFNDKTTWGWNGCNDLFIGINICLSSGTPPLPAAISNALCGPTVPGTKPPTSGQSISDLNPCPLNACCDVWGQCGTTPEYCQAVSGPTGNPGTAPAGQAGCVSNCGTSVVNNSKPPASWTKIAYYESWNWDRPCLNYRAQDIGATNYTHAHWAFATIGTDYSVSINDTYNQLSDFLQLPQKRVVSFGGWGYSTDPATYDQLRDAMDPGNVDTFVTNIVNYLNTQGFDGVDIDWEYPGAPDIPGIPPGLASDGPNYLTFLQKLRAALPSGKTLSIAAPASYWYLKSFPIADMAKELDYLVFMTYDLHGQWDYNSPWSQDGCPAGDCLRSHVNITETEYALAMITKAGVEANKIIVGVSSYGRSFGLASRSACDSGINSPGCVFLGPNSAATPGECTETAGYISNAEIIDILAANATDTVATYDPFSDSDFVLYGSNWVAYMSDYVKTNRSNHYEGVNFGGIVDWAVDLQAFTDDDGEPDGDDDDLPPTSALPPCDASYSTLDDLDAAASSIPDHCVTVYTLTALNNLLTQAMNNYTSLMSNGYDSKFSTYANAVASQAGNSLYDFVNSNGNKYFTCIIPETSICCSVCKADQLTPSYCDYCFSQGSCYTWSKRGLGLFDRETAPQSQEKEVVKIVNVTEPCPPDYSKRGYGPNNPYIQSVYWTLVNDTGFYADLETNTGIPKDKTKISNWDRGNDCSPHAPLSDSCWTTGVDFNIPVVNGFSASDVLNPKSTVQQALTNAQNLGPQIQNIITELGMDGWIGDGSELIDAVSLPILMLASATQSMAQVVQIANTITEEERKATILEWLTAIFLIVPIAGEVVGSIADLADIASIMNLIGAAGNAAVDIYSIVDDPNNSALAIFDLILTPLSLADLGTISKASDLRRDMKADDISKLGKDVESRMTTIEKVKGTCMPDDIEG